MHNKEKKYFNLLKQEVVKTFKQSFPGASDLIEDWKGQTIILFQDDLLNKTNANISEKWFYNHMKSKREKLPRIDMLNILSSYCGYSDWQEFTYKNQEFAAQLIPDDKSNKVFIYVSVWTISLVTVFYLIYYFSSMSQYEFCFVNADDLSPVLSDKILVETLKEGESGKLYTCDSTACFNFKTRQKEIKFVITAPYYKTDTLVRTLKKFDNKEIIKLYTDDYSLMLHYFSTSKVEAWKNRRNKLNLMFAENAIIYEVYKKGTTGMEMYDKYEFINKITMPSKTIEGIDILNIEYDNGKIAKLRFSSASY